MEIQPIVIGTAGHIDHGKSTLVQALTGTDPDRWEEEKERGMTIDLGFARIELPDGRKVGIVDVPGHERFVRNMLAGAAGIDLVLLVVDVNEGVMPQTREHLDIVNLLGVQAGCVALTKIDTAEPEYTEIVASEVEDLLAGTTLAGAPMVPVSGATGAGLPELRDTLGALAARVQAKSATGLCRLPIDRVFTMRGHGTVITGTLTGGTLRTNDELVALPAGVRTRVRHLQSHGETVEEAHAGTRVAVNCGGISTGDLGRGDTLVHAEEAEATGFFNARVHVLPAAGHPIRHRKKLKCYVGTAFAVATPVLLDGDEYGTGTTGFAQLRLDRPLLALRGDRFILRTGSPEITIGGGEVLDPTPAKVRRRSHVRRENLAALADGDDQRAALQWLRESAHGLSTPTVARRLGVPPAVVEPLLAEAQREGSCSLVPAHPEPLWIHRETLEAAAEQLRTTVQGFFAAHPTRMNMPREEARTAIAARFGVGLAAAVVAHLVAAGEIAEAEGAIRLAGRRVELPPRLAELKARLLELYAAAGAAPPLIAHLARELHADAGDVDKVLAALQEEGNLVRAGNTLAYTRDQWDRIAQAIGAHFDSQETLAVNDLKALLGVTRKYAMPILEYADATGLTIRKGDVRVRRR